MKKRVFMVLIGLVAVLASAKEVAPKEKYLVVLQAGNETNEGMARAVHALLYATELAENGYDVVLVFDGAGTGWAKELNKPENPYHKYYLRIQQLGMVEEICDYCAEQFDVKEGLSERQKTLLSGGYEGHPSLVRWIKQGYQVIVL